MERCFMSIGFFFKKLIKNKLKTPLTYGTPVQRFY